MRWLWLLVFLAGCNEDAFYADGTPWGPVVPLDPGNVPPGQMTEREWARYARESGIQAERAVKTFTPTSWLGFSSDPSGDISYYDFGAIVYLWVDTALTGTSDEAFMALNGVPVSLRPRANRYVRCLLLDENNLRGGVAVVGTSGAITFSLEVVESSPTDTIGFDNVFTDPSSLGSKGLQAGWMIQYAK